MIPVFINSLFYQEYINIDEQSIYENQVKNATVTLQEDVSLSQSEIFWNNERINVSSSSFEISINQEGENTLIYVLKDENGEILEEDSKTFVLDSVSPRIQVSCDGYVIQNEIYVIDLLTLDVNVQDDYLESTAILLDGVKQDSNQVLINSNNKELIVEAVDKAGNHTSRTIHIQSIPSLFPKWNVADDAYTLEAIEFNWNQNLESKIGMNISGAENETLYYENTSKEIYQPNHSGTYSIYFQSELYPYLKSNEFHFYYTNKKPEIAIKPDSDYSNESIHIQFQKNSDFLKDAWISINGNKHDWQDEINVSADENEDITYTIQAYVLDQFGQETSDEVQVRVDRQAPEFNIKANDHLIMNQLEFESIHQLELIPEEDSMIEVSYVLNGVPIQVQNLERFLNSMNINDILVSNYSISDSLGNQVQKSYTWKKIGILQTIQNENRVSTIERIDDKKEETEEKLEIPIVETKVEDYQNGYIEYRTWTLDENQNIVLQNEKKTNIKKSRVLILSNKKLKKGDSIRIVFMKYSPNAKDDIVWMKINGKKVKGKTWKTDTLGNLYYSLKIKEDTTIEVKVKRESGEMYRYKKELKIQRQKITKNDNLIERFKDILNDIFYG